MFLRFALASILPLLAYAADPIGSRCGSHLDHEQVSLLERSFLSVKASLGIAADGERQAGNFTVPVYWHVIKAGEDYTQGNLSDEDIYKQMTVLNERYLGTNLAFQLISVDRTLNESWFKHLCINTSYNTDAKTALRVGDAATLNVYTTGFTEVSRPYKGILGYSTFPAKYSGNPIDDGVVIQFGTLPGGKREPYNLGMNLVHEIGHWLGLYHTFQNGCDEPGDYVSDTPAEYLPSSDCSTSEPKDSCPDDPGLDPVSNYMDYSYDVCLNEFTPGQIVRIKEQIAVFRGINV